MNRLFLLLLMLIAVVPALVRAENKPSEALRESDVLLSDTAKAPPAHEAPKDKKKKTKQHARKVPFEGSTINPLGMTEEEQHIMQARNNVDRYRTRTPKLHKQPK